MEEDLEHRNTTLQKFIVDDQYRLLRHAVLLIFSLVIIFYSNWQYEYSGKFRFYRLLCVFIGLNAMCYVNMFVLVPLFFFKRRYLTYFIMLSLIVLLFQSLLSAILERFFQHGPGFNEQAFEHAKGGSYEGFIILVPIILVTTMIKLFQRWTRDGQRIADLNNITLRMELNELKNQINPHFLFNMLNGIKALIRTEPEKATHVIMKLSEFLRYQIYENNGEKTLLRSELTFLSNFLSLEKIRRDQFNIDIDSSELDSAIHTIYIEPNLLTTFVENAVKHSVDINGKESYVRIKVVVAKGQLIFCCLNSKDPGFMASDGKNSGVGLVNIKRRLQLIYQQNYSLDIDDQDRQFKITLIIPV